MIHSPVKQKPVDASLAAGFVILYSQILSHPSFHKNFSPTAVISTPLILSLPVATLYWTDYIFFPSEVFPLHATLRVSATTQHNALIDGFMHLPWNFEWAESSRELRVYYDFLSI